MEDSTHDRIHNKKVVNNRLPESKGQNIKMTYTFRKEISCSGHITSKFIIDLTNCFQIFCNLRNASKITIIIKDNHYWR